MPAEVKRRWHADDARALQQEDRAWPRYEVIDGELLVTPAPFTPHQYVVGAIFLALGTHLRGNRNAEAWMSPADIQLQPDTTVQPDVFVTPRIRPARTWAAIPSLYLAVEVVSPSSARQDRHIKRRFYQRHRVTEYWIVDIQAEIVERWRPDDERPEIVTDQIEWIAPGTSGPPVTIDLRPIFAECRALVGPE